VDGTLERSLPEATANITRNSPEATSSNTTSSDLTMSGLKDELSSLKEEMEEREHQHSKATIAAAATIGSLLLLAVLACAGVLVYRRFVSSQHTGHKKGRADKLPYYNYDDDKLLADAAGM